MDHDAFVTKRYIPGTTANVIGGTERDTNNRKGIEREAFGRVRRHKTSSSRRKSRSSAPENEIDPLDQAKEIQGQLQCGNQRHTERKRERPQQQEQRQLPMRGQQDQQLSTSSKRAYQKRDRVHPQKHHKTTFANKSTEGVNPVLERLSEKMSATVDLCSDDGTDDDDNNIESKPKPEGTQRIYQHIEGEKSELKPENVRGATYFVSLIDKKMKDDGDSNFNHDNDDDNDGDNDNDNDNNGRDSNKNDFDGEDRKNSVDERLQLEEQSNEVLMESRLIGNQLSRRKNADEGENLLDEQSNKGSSEFCADEKCSSLRNKVAKNRNIPNDSFNEGDDINEPPRQKKRENPLIQTGSMKLIVPALKHSSHLTSCKRQKNESRNTDQAEDRNINDFENSNHKQSVPDFDCDSQNYCSYDQEHQSKPKGDGSYDIMKVVNDVASSNTFVKTDEINNRRRTMPRRTDTSSSTPDTNSQNSSSSLKLLKLNHKRKKTQGKKIVAGQAIQTSSKNYDSIQREQKVQDSNNWNALTGENYTRGTIGRTNGSSGSSRESENHQKLGTNRSNTLSSTRRKADDSVVYSQEGQTNNRRCKRYRKIQTPETIDITNSDSEDDDIVMKNNDQGDDTSLQFTLKRLAVNKRVLNIQDHVPTIKYDYEANSLVLSYYKSKDKTRGYQEILIGMGDAQEVAYFEMNDEAMEHGIDLDLDNFIYLRAVAEPPGAKGRLRPNRKECQFVLEFEEDQHFRELLDVIKESDLCSPFEAQPGDIEEFTRSLIADSKRNYNLRQRGPPKKQDPFIAKKKSDEILLVYPFEEDRGKIEAAVYGLKELSYKVTYDDENKTETRNPKKSNFGSEAKDLTTTQGSQRSHHIVIRVEDYEKLESRQWLNDSLVDLWMQWISRNIHCKQSDVYFFSSHFYSTLVSDGPAGVESWTARKNINIFEKKMIFIPINKTLHWSLCVIVNPGTIQTSVDNGEDSQHQPVSCMLFFDSLKMHCKQNTKRLLVGWLNSEWKRIKKTSASPFIKKKYPIYDPEVPLQDNGSDCGVFVCRYALAMLKLRHLKFTNKEAGIEKAPDSNSSRITRQKTRSSVQAMPFQELITNGNEFDFDCNDIERIRNEYQIFIQKLHPLYTKSNMVKIETEKEGKKVRKELRHKEKTSMAIQDTTMQISGLGITQESHAVVPSSIDEPSDEVVSSVAKSPCGSLTKSPYDSTNNSTDSGKENLASFKDQKESQLTKDQTSEDLKYHSEYNMECDQSEFQKRALQINGPSDQVHGGKISHRSRSCTANVEKEGILSSTSNRGTDDSEEIKKIPVEEIVIV